MTIDQIREMLGWCTLINVGLMLFSYLFICTARAWVYKMHSKWLPITEEQFNGLIYGIFGVYKILIIVFNLVPYLALSIIGQG